MGHAVKTVAVTRFSRGVRGISTALAVCAGVFLLAATIIISLMVVKRALGMQNVWELELAIELMVAAIFLGSPYTLATGGYVSMDLLTGVLGATARRAWQGGLRLIGVVVCLYVAWEGLRLTLDAYHSAERALGLWQPLVWPKYATVPIGMFLTALQYVANMVDAASTRTEQSS